ncbi:hypothetical protein [Maritalea mediterranea]|uniref:Uncharacterized protein n=1 Tax=Maritalea mediterranea TaxID=2909667 RepID=A0ABS9E597_9HYPH|nr:hypothetical protein [Maritalea mediterranea]MCF4098030.1 hypothetical protein [Maritalea mediterranea]
MRHAPVCYILTTLIGISAGQVASAADFPTDLRGGYTEQGWAEWDDNPLVGIRAGMRYSYSLGGGSVTTEGVTIGPTSIPGGTSEFSDVVHSGELYLRIDDYSTNTYLKAVGGYSMALSADYSNSYTSGTTDAGKVAHFKVDLGYMPIELGDDENGLKIGGFAGYQYMHEGQQLGAANFNPINSNADLSWVTDTENYFVPIDYAQHSLNVNAMRLGVNSEAKLGPFDIEAEFTAIPYAQISGVLGFHGFNAIDQGAYTTYKSTASQFDGSGWGGETELMLGYNINENFAIRAGGRASYLQASGDLVYGLADVTDPVDSDTDGIYETGPATGGTYYLVPEKIDALSMWRYGILAELTYSF